ncbi:hypothetical protein BU23DRAFT_575002 [Bimuria novae-zelandiae CBS 107.79]|uniref:Uncharacterized protein n=1 Tax=Bimuria novae-zelandiae CBS 107.79 TaxID=1447943 RepID=A0A6A5UNA4_9PLEO|nr:hypothetical protein BU23DRAFT_575002 [Bimuria novae-zelandiae CBS 107.79]
MIRDIGCRVAGCRGTWGDATPSARSVGSGTCRAGRTTCDNCSFANVSDEIRASELRHENLRRAQFEDFHKIRCVLGFQAAVALGLENVGMVQFHAAVISQSQQASIKPVSISAQRFAGVWLDRIDPSYLAGCVGDAKVWVRKRGLPSGSARARKIVIYGTSYSGANEQKNATGGYIGPGRKYGSVYAYEVNISAGQRASE